MPYPEYLYPPCKETNRKGYQQYQKTKKTPVFIYPYVAYAFNADKAVLNNQPIDLQVVCDGQRPQDNLVFHEKLMKDAGISRDQLQHHVIEVGIMGVDDKGKLFPVSRSHFGVVPYNHKIAKSNLKKIKNKINFFRLNRLQKPNLRNTLKKAQEDLPTSKLPETTQRLFPKENKER